MDPNGTLNPEYNESAVRFVLYVKDYEPDEEPMWKYKVEVIDHKYLDSDSLPISSIAGGESMRAAFLTASEMVTEALATDHCIF